MAQDLRFLLAERGVGPELIGQLEAAGLRTVSLFFLAADTKAEMRAFLKEPPFNLSGSAEGIDSAEKVRRTVAQAQVLDAWIAAEARVKERTATEATQRAGSLPLTLPAGDHVVIRRRYEDVHGRVEDSAFPAEAVIDRRLQEVELNALVAEPLSDVASRAEGADDPLAAVVDRDGSLRLRRGASRIALPTDSEALRRRLHVLAASFVVARDRHPSTVWLATATHEAWREHMDYVLGEKVYGLRIPGLDTNSGPDWSIVLSYEHAIRKEAVRSILYDGMGFQEAMRKARSGTELRELTFVAPTMASFLARGRRAPTHPATPANKKAKKEKNQTAVKGGKGAGKGLKGKAKQSKGAWHNATADGSAICFAFNSATERCDGKCGRVHCCQVCLGQHPAHKHGQSGASGSAAE